jgi:serine/threonine protein kinase
MADRVGQQLGNYRLLSILGRGAFAAVYLGKHQYLERLAAIKVLHIQIEPGTHESFRREARTIAQLHHPHIISVHDFGIEDQTPYLVMEYMQGGTLRSRYPKGTRLPCEQIVAYVRQIAAALDYAHEQQVIHRDVKPENILLGANQEVMLSDFGLAVVQDTLDSLSMQNSAGTPVYMAPEQIRHEPCPASDQYALGVMVYEWLCGEPPFYGPLFEVFSQHLYRSPPSLCARVKELPSAVEDAVMRTLAKDPLQRFISVADFASVLSDAFFATQLLSLNGFVEHGPQDQSALPAARVSLVTVLSPSEQEPSDNTTQPLLKTVPRIDRGHELAQSVSSAFTTHSHHPSKQTKSSIARTTRRLSVQEQNRERMLQRLRCTYEELFAQSLAGVTQMELGLSDKPEAVQNAATLLFQTSTHSEQLLPPGTSILHVYDEAAQELLILGAPGAGKSTLLVELARQLVARAEADETHPLPVILPLSSWAVKRPVLQIWLAEQVAQFYNIPQVLARRWIDEDQLLLLLDGLDEMEEAARPACIAAINTYHHEHLRLPLVVCSRQAEYEEAASQQRLALQNAIVVQPLSHEQVQAHLAQADQPFATLRHILTTNPALAEIATTPLMVHILILTYQGTSVQQLSMQHEQLQQQIWTDYLARMVERKGNARRYPHHQTCAWLGWLAQQMRARNQTVFYLEHLQPDWLTDRQRCAYKWLGVRLPAMMIGALVSILIGWFLHESVWSSLLQAVTLGGLLGGLLCPKVSGDTARAAAKKLRRWGTTLSISVGVGLVIGWSHGWNTNTTFNDCLSYGVIFSLSSLLLQYMLSPPPHCSLPPSSPNSGRWVVLKDFVQQLHLLRALLVALLIGLSVGRTIGTSVGLSLGLSLGLACMLISAVLGRLQDAIHLTEHVSFSWRNLRKRLFAPAHLRLALLLTGEIVLFVGLSIGLNYVLSFGLGFGLLYWLLLGFYQSIVQERIEDQDRRVPNQGIRLSLRNSLLIGLICGIKIVGIGIVTFGLSEGLRHGLRFWLSYVLGYFWSLFVVSSILVWIIMGGLAVWRHYLIRFLLRCSQTFPLNACQFLDDATARILLLRLGGGYRFTHRLLLDSLADAEDRCTKLPSASMVTHSEPSVSS